MNKRLLTVKEISQLRINFLSGLPSPPTVAEAQDAKTLRAVVDWLKHWEVENYIINHGEYIPNGKGVTLMPDDWEALKQGKIDGS